MTAVYDIEYQVFSGRFARHYTRSEGMPIEDQQAVVDRLCGNPLFLEPITVQRLRGSGTNAGWACSDTRRIGIGDLAGPAVVCHEVAHIITDPDAAAHGWQFRNSYVLCIDIVLGRFQANRLRQAFGGRYQDRNDRATTAGDRQRAVRENLHLTSA